MAITTEKPYNGPTTLVAHPDHPFMPREPVEGYRGFYPAPANWPDPSTGQAPLPMRCVSIAEGVKAVHVRMMFHVSPGPGLKPVFHHMKVRLRPEEAIRHLFCRTGVSVDRFQVEWRDGTDVLSFASWRQDRRTGAFAIFSGANNSHTPCVTQGGYLGHMPANVRWVDESFGLPWDNWAATIPTKGAAIFNQ